MAATDKAHNTAEAVRGKAKEVLGRAAKDEGLQIEGMVEQVAAHVKQAGEKVKGRPQERFGLQADEAIRVNPLTPFGGGVS